MSDGYSLLLIDVTSKSLMSVEPLADTIQIDLTNLSIKKGCICLVKQIDSLYKLVSGNYFEMIGEE